MKYLAGILLLLVCGVVQAATCLANITCMSWKGDGRYTDNKLIPASIAVSYTVLNGPKGGPYVPLYAYNGSPTQAMSVQFATPAAPKLCFVMTATTFEPNDKGVIVKNTSVASAESCDKVALPAPTNGSIVAPTDGSIINRK